MSILKLLERNEEKKPLGVCIPIHRKEGKIGEEPESREAEKDYSVKSLAPKGPAVFKVLGRYEIRDTLMLSGVVEFGTLKKRMKTKIGGKDLGITEIRVRYDAVDELPENHCGTIFIKAKTSPIIQHEELLEFN